MKKFSLLISLSLILLAFSTHAQFINDLNTFEAPDSLLHIDTSLIDNIWQIGRPSKIFFDSAWSIPNAILTDTLQSYPTNNFSAFTIKVYDPAWNIPGDEVTSISYFHKFDTDSLHDGGYIEFSYDAGVNWINISNLFGFYYSQNGMPNPTIGNGNAAYTGRSYGLPGGWRSDSFVWCNITNSINYIRFVFYSDSIPGNKEGWMIDNIGLHLEICEGIRESRNDNLITLFPNPVDDQLNLKEILQNRDGSVQIFDFTGKLVFENLNFGGKPIDTYNMINGVYLLKYADNRYFSLKKFVVLH